MQPDKKRRLNRESSAEPKAPQKEKEIIISKSNLAIVPFEAPPNQGKIEHGQTTQISEDEFLGI